MIWVLGRASYLTCWKRRMTFCGLEVLKDWSLYASTLLVLSFHPCLPAQIQMPLLRIQQFLEAEGEVGAFAG